MGGDQLMFISHIDAALSPSFLPLPKINKSTSLGKDLKKISSVAFYIGNFHRSSGRGIESFRRISQLFLRENSSLLK